MNPFVYSMLMAAPSLVANAQICAGTDGVMSSMVVNTYTQAYDFDFDDKVMWYDLPYPLLTI
jgi:hypothetical protein